MARIDARLLDRLETKLGLGKSQVYALIDKKVRDAFLPRHLAAIALASERGINISRFATADDLSALKQAARDAAPPPVVVAAASAAPAAGRARKRSGGRQPARRRGNSVFVVHGRDEKAKRELFTFLRALALQPIEWVQAIKRTGEATPYVGAILDAAFHDAAAVVVLLTPDDEARLRKQFKKAGDAVYEARLTGQARANVLFEAGMAFGRNPDSTVLVQLGDVRQFSDVAGRHIVRLGNDPASRLELATKLANAGCNVNTSGEDWLTAGDFRA